jgi:hypothetical protein
MEELSPVGELMAMPAPKLAADEGVASSNAISPRSLIAGVAIKTPRLIEGVFCAARCRLRTLAALLPILQNMT